MLLDPLTNHLTEENPVQMSVLVEPRIAQVSRQLQAVVPYGMKILDLRCMKWDELGLSEKTRRRMARERRGAGSSLVSMETPYYKTIY
jgi:hypothetical protein